MADKIRANYPAMEEMAKQMETVDGRLGELMNSILGIIDLIQSGALQGDPGDALVTALTLLFNKTSTLATTTGNQAKGIRAAISDMQQADTAATGDFN